MLSTFEQVIIEKKRCFIVVFQPSVVFHIEKVIWFALQIMPSFHMKCYTGLKQVKRESLLRQILRLVCQNVSKEVLLTGLKIQTKIPSHSGDCLLAEGQLNAFPLMAKGLGIFTIEHQHGTRPGVSCLIHYETLLQNATDIITKCDSYFITKCDRSLLQIAMILLQNATVITKCDIYYKLRQYKQ